MLSYFLNSSTVSSTQRVSNKITSVITTGLYIITTSESPNRKSSPRNRKILFTPPRARLL